MSTSTFSKEKIDYFSERLFCARAGVYPVLVGGGGNQTAGTEHSEKAEALNSLGK
jgi:hypothetical protein